MATLALVGLIALMVATVGALAVTATLVILALWRSGGEGVDEPMA